jgi:curli biogenesis system outer membrane secretion channel CsgG
MRKWTFPVYAAAAALAALFAVAPLDAQSKRPGVAVLDLDFGAVTKWWEGDWDIGKGVADLIVDALIDDGSFRIFERKKLEAVMSEQNLANSDRADPSAATIAKIGKIQGVRYLVTGSITKFGTENKGMKVGGGGFGGGFLGGAKVGTSKGTATVALTVRMIDTTTSEIMLSAKGEGQSKRSGLMLGGGGGKWGGGGGGEISMGSTDFRETILGEAVDIAVKNLVGQIIAKKDRLGSN